MNKIKTYALATITALGLTYNLAAQEINEIEKIKEKQESQMNNIREKYLNTIDEATILWNEAISKQHITIQEQNKIVQLYTKSEKNREHHNELVNNLNLEREKIAEGNNTYFKLMKKNVIGFDWGKTELEKKINEDGIYLSVERAVSQKEGLTILGLIALGLGGLLLYLRK